MTPQTKVTHRKQTRTSLRAPTCSCPGWEPGAAPSEVMAEASRDSSVKGRCQGPWAQVWDKPEQELKGDPETDQTQQEVS